MADFWDNADVIDTYTDKQAVEDGFLVDVAPLRAGFQGRPVNRMTRSLWDEFQPFLLDYSNGLAAAAGVKMPTKMQQLASILRTKLRLASCRGGIWQVPPGLWLVENELGGWTMMRPEDY